MGGLFERAQGGKAQCQRPSAPDLARLAGCASRRGRRLGALGNRRTPPDSRFNLRFLGHSHDLMAGFFGVTVMSQPVVFAVPADVELLPAPIPERWVIEGTPQARSARLAASADGASTIIAWSCTAGRFKWNYPVDETIHVISGEVFVTDEKGAVRRIGPGDMVFSRPAAQASGTCRIMCGNSRSAAIACRCRPVWRCALGTSSSTS